MIILFHYLVIDTWWSYFSMMRGSAQITFWPLCIWIRLRCSSRVVRISSGLMDVFALKSLMLIVPVCCFKTWRQQKDPDLIWSLTIHWKGRTFYGCGCADVQGTDKKSLASDEASQNIIWTVFIAWDSKDWPHSKTSSEAIMPGLCDLCYSSLHCTSTVTDSLVQVPKSTMNTRGAHLIFEIQGSLYVKRLWSCHDKGLQY